MLLPGAADDVGVVEAEVDETVDCELVEELDAASALEVAEVVEVEDVVLETEDVELGPIVVKGNMPPVSVKAPSPVWQSHFEVGSLSQQNSVLLQITTPASEREL